MYCVFYSEQRASKIVDVTNREVWLGWFHEALHCNENEVITVLGRPMQFMWNGSSASEHIPSNGGSAYAKHSLFC